MCCHSISLAADMAEKNGMSDERLNSCQPGQNDSYVHGRQGLYSSHMNNGRSDNEYLLVMGR